MYKDFETSDDVFGDREEYITWMDDALSLSNLAVLNEFEKRQMEWEEKCITFEEIP